MPCDFKFEAHHSLEPMETFLRCAVAESLAGPGCVPRSVEKERHPLLRHQSIISGGNLRVFENLAQRW